MVKKRSSQLPSDLETCQLVRISHKSKILRNSTFEYLQWLDIFNKISDDYFPDRILEAEKICDKHEMEQFPNEGDDLQVVIVDNGTHTVKLDDLSRDYYEVLKSQAKFKFAATRQLASLVEWAKHIPHFKELPLEDQVDHDHPDDEFV